MAKHNTMGKIGERIACDFLIEHGFIVRETNWRLGHLEIDIVAQEPDENCLHIVEVKTRASDEDFDPMIEHYSLPMTVQFDVMIIVGTPPDDFDIRYYPDAIDPPIRTYR